MMGDDAHYPRDRSQLKELQSRVEELEMRNIKLEELLKTHVFTDVNHPPQDVHINDLKNGMFVDGEKEWNTRFGTQNSTTCVEEQKLNLLSFNPVNQTNYSGQTFIGSQNTVAPACNTFIQTSTPAFVQNNQNTLVQNNTNLIQPINLVNIAGAHGGATTNGAAHASGLGQQLNVARGGFLLLPDGRISYLAPNNTSACSSSSSSSVENVLNEKLTSDNAPKFFILPAANQTTHAPLIHHHQSHVSSPPPPVVVVAESSLKRQRPLRPKPPLSLVTPTVLLAAATAHHTQQQQQLHHESTDEALTHAASILLSPSSTQTQANDMSPSNLVNFESFFPSEEHTLVDEETLTMPPPVCCPDESFKQPRQQRSRQAKGLRCNNGHPGKNLRRRGRPPKTMKTPDVTENLCPCKVEVLRESFHLDFSKDLHDINFIALPEERVHIEKFNADLNFQRFQHLFYSNLLNQYYMSTTTSTGSSTSTAKSVQQHLEEENKDNKELSSGLLSSSSSVLFNNDSTTASMNNFNSTLSDGFSYSNSQSALVMIEEIQRDLLDSLSSASIPHSVEKSAISLDPSLTTSFSKPLVDNALWSSAGGEEGGGGGGGCGGELNENGVYQSIGSPTTSSSSAAAADELTLSPFKSCIDQSHSPMISDLKCFKNDLFPLHASEITDSLYNDNFRRRLNLTENSSDFCSDRLVAADNNSFNHVAFVNSFKENSISSSSTETILSTSFLQDTNSSPSSVNEHLLTHGFTASDAFGVTMDFGS